MYMYISLCIAKFCRTSKLFYQLHSCSPKNIICVKAFADVKSSSLSPSLQTHSPLYGGLKEEGEREGVEEDHEGCTEGHRERRV